MPIQYLDEYRDTPTQPTTPSAGITYDDAPQQPQQIQYADEMRDPTPDEVRQHLYTSPNPVVTRKDAEVLYAEGQNKPIGEKISGGVAAAASAIPEIVLDLGRNIGQGGAQAVTAYKDQGRSAAEVGAGLGLSTGEGVLRQILDLGHQFLRGNKKMSDAALPAHIRQMRMQMALSQPEGVPLPPEPKVDPVAQFQQRLQSNVQWDRMRQDMATGKQGGWIDPLGGLTQNGMLYPGVSEVAATVVDPTVLVPGGLLTKGAVTAGEKVAQKAISRAAGEGVVSRVAEKVGTVAEKTADVAGLPGRFLKKTADAVLPETGIGSVVAAGPAAAGATVAVPARAIQKGAEVAEQLGRTSGQSSAGRLTELSMSETAPAWVRGAARHMARLGVDKGAALAGDIVKSGATGAAIGAAIAAPGAETPEEVGAAAGSGFGLASLTHTALAPAVAGRKHRAAQDFDILRWYENKAPEEKAAIDTMNLDRDQALSLMTVEAIANGFLDPNANVRFAYQDSKTFEATHGAQRAVAIVQSDVPTIIFNVGKMKTRTAYHELFHQLSRSPEIVDYGALTTKLLGVTNDAGQVVQPGLLGKADLARLGDVYFSRLDPIGQKSVEMEKAAFDKDPNSPDAAAWTKRIVNEVGAELFANLSRDTKGSLLEAIDKPTLQLVDAMTLNDRSQWVRNWGQKLQKALGVDPNVESDIFPGLKATPEIQSMLRDFVRAKRNLTKTPTFNEENADASVTVNPRDAFRPGGDEIVKKFPDNDNFAKDAQGKPVYAGGRPVLLSEGEIKKVQTKRAEEMTKVLTTVPDSGEAGVMRPTEPVVTAPAPAPALPPGAVAKPSKARVVKNLPGFRGKHFSDAQIAALEALPNDVLTPSMKSKLRTLNDLVKRGDGSPILLFYNAALKNRRYSSAIRETARVISPIAMSITKAGNFTVTGLDITAFNSKLQRWLTDKPKAFEDFNGSPDLFIEKTQQYLANHKAGQPGATGLDADAAKAVRMRNRIQDFLNIRDIASEALNPDRLSKNNDKDGLIRAFRFDRMNRIEEAHGDKFPLDYELVKKNFSPEGEKKANEELKRSDVRGFITQQGSGFQVFIPENGDSQSSVGQYHNADTFAEAQDWLSQQRDPDASAKLEKTTQTLDKESGQYSQLERTIDQKIKGESVPAMQLAAMLRNPQSGVKTEEIKWTGLEEFLKGRERVSKQELLDFVRANRLQIEEKRLGEKNTIQTQWKGWQRDPNNGTLTYVSPQSQVFGEVSRVGGEFEAYVGGSVGEFKKFPDEAAAKAWIESLNPRQEQVVSQPTKYEQYKSPGGENYREILFRFPEAAAQVEDRRVFDPDKNHWNTDQRNFAHARVQDYDGGKTLLIDEIQSDWHQQGRKKGYDLSVDEFNKLVEQKESELQRRADAARIAYENHQKTYNEDYLKYIVEPLKTKLFDRLSKDIPTFKREVAQPQSLRELKDLLPLTEDELNSVDTVIEQGDTLETGLRIAESNWERAQNLIRNAREMVRSETGFGNKASKAPFDKTWHEFVFKRLLRDAVERGYQAIEWPDGGTIAKRFNLNQHMTELHYAKDRDSRDGEGWAIQPDGDEGDPMFIPDSTLADHVGAGVAERMRKGEGRSRENGDGWKVLKGEMELDSGESRGMKQFYDNILPQFANKYVKKWGSEVKDTTRAKELGLGSRMDLAELDRDLSRLEAEMEEAAQRPMSAALRLHRLQQQHAELTAEKQKLLQTGGFPVHRVEITPQMRQEVSAKGQTLFSPDVTPEQVRDLPPEKFAVEARGWKGGLTGQAIEYGKSMKAEDMPKLQSYLDESRRKSKDIRAKGDLQGAMLESLRSQYFREAMEAYRAAQGEEGLSIRPEDVNKSETTPIGVNSEKKVVDNQGNPDNIGGMVEKLFSPDEVQFKRAKPLPNAVGDVDVPVVHFSSQPGLKKLDPAYIGKGQANSRDRRGGPKSFFFVAESPLGADEQFFGKGKVVYGAVVSGTRLYDLRIGKPDPLGYNNALNPLAAEETLASKGYAGVLVEGGKDDPRKTVVLFKRAAVKELPVPPNKALKKAPRVDFSPDVQPSQEVRAQADEYVKQAGLTTTPHQTAVPVREDLAKRLADAFDAMKHSPDDPAVKASYDALAKETKAQWDFITSKGVKMEPWVSEGQPYKNSAEMVADVRDNKHLWFFPTDQGFGSDNKTTKHPMLTPIGVKVNGKDLVVNDVFRAVHDYFGHAKEGFEFGPKGEYNAYLAHNQMFSDAARPALAAETLAQNSWVNYGKHLRRADGTIPKKGEGGFVHPTERPYADQKAGLLPSDLVAEANDIAPKKSVDKTAPMMSPDDMVKGAKRALSILAADGNGVTLNIATGRNMAKRKAFAVSIFPERSMILDKAPERADLEKFITDNQDLLSQPENALGIWHDKQGGKYYVDVSVAVEDPAFAKYLGQKYNQKAIWDFQKMAEIPTGGTGDAIEGAPVPTERIPLAKQEFKAVSQTEDLFAAEKREFVQSKVQD